MIQLIIQYLILIILIVFAFLTVKSKDLFVSLICLAVVSLALATEYYILQAPDVAITEAAIGVGMSTAIFAIAIHKTRRYE